MSGLRDGGSVRCGAVRGAVGVSRGARIPFRAGGRPFGRETFAFDSMVDFAFDRETRSAMSMFSFGPGEPPFAPSLQRFKDYARQRQMTLSDLLLENRIIFLEGVINDVMANHVIKQFLYLQFENRTQGISFYINSPGGSVYSTLAIYDTMQFVDCTISTYCIGLAASGAAILLASGTKGKRFSLPHSKIMIHQPHGYVGGQVSDIEIQADEILKNKKIINEILAKHTGQPIERVAKDTERDRYLSAADAKEYGIVDEVVGKASPGEGRRNTGFVSPPTPSSSDGGGGPTPGAGTGAAGS